LNGYSKLVENSGAVKNTDAPPFLISAKLAKALANPWRNRILIELHLRPMSPTQFADQFGGPGLKVISRYFRQLKEWGYLEVAEELRGGRRRGAVEKVYRAIQRVHFDTKTWEGLPRYLRDECSGAILESLLLRIAQAVEAETFDAEPDRHLSWRALPLDRQAWTQYVTRLDEVLESINELEAESAMRIAATGEAPIFATVALLAFRSPEPGANESPRPSRTPAKTTGAPAFLISAKMAKALANPWRNRILIELHARPMSPTQFADEFGGPELTTIARYFRQLKEWGYLEVAEELRGGRRRGAVEKVYRAVPRAHFDSATWEGLPQHLRNEYSGAVLDALVLRITEAVKAKTFDAESSRHLAWKAVSLDRRAWTEQVTRLDEVLAWVGELKAESAARTAATKGQDPEQIPATVALMAFRSPVA